MAAAISETERKLRVEEFVERDRLADGRLVTDRNDETERNGGLEWNGDGERVLTCSDEPAVWIQGAAAPACRTAVPREFQDESELERGSESELSAPCGRKVTLELSNVTKLGLEGAPMGSKLGLDGAPMGSKLGLDGAPICSMLGLE